MALPFSKSQVDKLGQRLAKAGPPSDADRAMLQDVIVCHASAVSDVRQLLDRFEDGRLPDVSITGRAKTTQTIVEKLVRNRTRLSSMEDLAGVRLVADMTLRRQDEVAAEICGLVGAEPNDVVDRRANPSSGYRAVHVIGRHDGLRVEVQVRTLSQDKWANLYEKMADMIGREIRYGSLPPGLDQASQAYIPAIVGLLGEVSDAMYEHEQAHDIDIEHATADQLKWALANLQGGYDAKIDSIQQRLTNLHP